MTAKATTDSVILYALTDEYPFSDKSKKEEAIKRQLQRKKLGPYDQKRVDHLRELNDELRHELGCRWKPWKNPDGSPSVAPDKPRYDECLFYKGSKGKYADYADFDIPALTAFLSDRYPTVSAGLMKDFVRWGVGMYYLM